MANLITLGRIVLLFIAIWLLYTAEYRVVVFAGFLIGITFLGDGLDGWVARRRGSSSRFGAVFDIAGDRIVENVLWVVFANLHIIGVWVPIVVITRSFIVDVVRAEMLTEGKTPFGDNSMARSSFTHFLTASRFTRAYYGWSKALAFVLLAWYVAWQLPSSEGTVVGSVYGNEYFRGGMWFVVYSSVAICVIRGLPVIYDAWETLKSEPDTADSAADHAVAQPLATPDGSSRERPA